MRKRRRTFASPFVLTVGIGCGGKSEPVDEPPVPPPTRTTDARPEDFLDFAPKPDAPEPPPPPHVDRIERRDRDCVKILETGTIPVNCPDDLMPDALPDELVVGYIGRCFRVYERKLGNRSSRYHWDEGEVRCPPKGPNVKLPDPTWVEIRNERFSLDEESLTCRRQVPANPPYNVSAPCPEPLLPQLVGLVPERTATGCTYQGVAVKCPTKRTP